MQEKQLRWKHIAGTMLCLAGTFLIVTKGWFEPCYAIAFACSFLWSGYSLLSRHFPSVPTNVII